MVTLWDTYLLCHQTDNLDLTSSVVIVSRDPEAEEACVSFLSRYLISSESPEDYRAIYQRTSVQRSVVSIGKNPANLCVFFFVEREAKK